MRLRVSGTGLNLAATPRRERLGHAGLLRHPRPPWNPSAAVRGYDYLGLRLTDDTGAEQSRVITEVRHPT